MPFSFSQERREKKLSAIVSPLGQQNFSLSMTSCHEHGVSCTLGFLAERGRAEEGWKQMSGS